MKTGQKLRYVLLGAIISLCISTLVIPAVAASMKNISVSSGVKLYIDDKLLTPTDVNGNEVETFIYNGTTYVPIRAVSQAFGYPIQWDGSTSSVYIGKHNSSEPAVMLKDLDYFTGKKFKVLSSDKDNLGNTHYECITKADDVTNSAQKNTYKINGQYSRISGLLYQRYDSRSDSKFTSELEIRGDGKLLYSSSVTGGVEPISFDVDITGVLELEVSIYGGSSKFAIADCGLYA